MPTPLQPDELLVRYIGPSDMRVFATLDPGPLAGRLFTFERGEPLCVPRRLADEVLAMNSRGCTLETAKYYGAHLFELVEGGEGQWASR